MFVFYLQNLKFKITNSKEMLQHKQTWNDKFEKAQSLLKKRKTFPGLHCSHSWLSWDKKESEELTDSQRATQTWGPIKLDFWMFEPQP